MSPRRAAALLALVVVGAALVGVAPAGAEDGGHSHGPPPGARPVPPEAFAMVGDVAVLRTQVFAEARRLNISEVMAFQRLITAEVMRQNLVRLGADPAAVSEADLDEGLAEAKAALVAQGGTAEHVAQLDGMRDALRVSVAFSRHVAALVPDEELVRDFAMWRTTLAAELRLRAIALRVDPQRGGVQVAQARATELQARLGAAPTDDAFAALAAEASDDPTAALTGGDLDWQSPRAPTVSLSLIEPALVHAAAGRQGLLPAPVVTTRAVYLLYVTAVRVPATATLEALLPRMRDEARARAAARLMDEWIEATPISVAADAPHLQRAR